MVESYLKVSVGDNGKIDKAINVLRDLKGRVDVDRDDVVRNLAQQLANTAAAKVLATPTHGTKHTGLLERVSAGVGIKPVPGGYAITTSMPQPDEAIIPRGLDTVASHGRGWRHPLFGNKNKWYRNYGAFSWFLGTMNDAESDGRDRMTAMLEAAVESAQASI